MIYDAVHLYAQALHDLDRSQEINTKPLSCDGTETWQHGNSLVNYMKLVSLEIFLKGLDFIGYNLFDTRFLIAQSFLCMIIWVEIHVILGK